MKKIFLLHLIIATAVFISSCSGLKEIENYKGENISMGVGEYSVVKMPADTKAGYDWNISANSDPTIAKYESREKLSGENNSSGDTLLIKFKGLKKGKTIITLNYVKKGDFLAKKTRTVNITVY